MFRVFGLPSNTGLEHIPSATNELPKIKIKSKQKLGASRPFIVIDRIRHAPCSI